MTTHSDLQVAALDRVHLVLNGATVCGRVREVDARDLYPPTSALLAWNDGPIARCELCAVALAARHRPGPSTTDAQPRGP